MKRAAAFLDRDGILNELVYYPDSKEMESPREPGALRIIEGVIEALSELAVAGWPLVLVSNQPSFAKGKTTLENLTAVHVRLEALLAVGGVQLTDAFYCYHHPHGVVPSHTGPCECRKPKPGALLKAAAKHEIDPSASWMIGDQDSDIECGIAAGCKTILVPNERSAAKRGLSQPHARASDLKSAVRIILQQPGTLLP